MSSISVIPEKFESGDFVSWLRQFECCATANNWTDADKLRKLPAFLRGPAAAYFHGLPANQKDAYNTLVLHLREVLCPLVDREHHYADFESRQLRPSEDPSLFLWSLQDLLSKADPTLSQDAKTALLGRQFIRGLPADLRLRLLEHDPTPTLSSMVDFTKRHRAIHRTTDHAHRNDVSHTFAAKAGHDVNTEDKLHASVAELTAAVASLTANQKSLQDVVVQQLQQHQHQQPQQQVGTSSSSSVSRWRNRRRPQTSEQQRCFNCNQLGHYARSCPWDAHCRLCFGFGHSREQCANNFLQQQTSPASDANSRPSDDVVENNHILRQQGLSPSANSPQQLRPRYDNSIRPTNPNNLQSLNFRGVAQ